LDDEALDDPSELEGAGSDTDRFEGSQAEDGNTGEDFDEYCNIAEENDTKESWIYKGDGFRDELQSEAMDDDAPSHSDPRITSSPEPGPVPPSPVLNSLAGDNGNAIQLEEERRQDRVKG
jgi:hypothetical protein